ncbi:MAG: hypothetical protein U0572_01735 [Phycisphaerales bacterium]
MLAASLAVSCAIAASQSHPQKAFTGAFTLHGELVELWLETLKPGTIVPWRTAEGDEIALHEWRGRQVSLLCARDDYDPVLVQRLLDAVDAYWLRCQEICGNAPPPDPETSMLLGGRPLLVERVQRVPDALVSAAEGDVAAPSPAPRHPAVGLVGVARTSITTDELESALRGVAAPSRAPLGASLPAALATNFCFFQSEIGPITPTRDVTAAYAALLASDACESLGWFAPADARPLDAILDRYERDANASYASTLADGATGTYETEALWAAFLMRVRHASGKPDFVQRLWRATSECPPATTSGEAIANLVVAASSASGADLSQRFLSWRFPVTPETKSRVREALSPQRLETTKAMQSAAPKRKPTK